MGYELYLRREAFEFLRRCRTADRDRLLTLLRTLANDPYRRGDFIERDRGGRAIEGLVFGRYAILYWADHAVKELKVVDIRHADR